MESDAVMEIVKNHTGERAELRLKGRLDASWCEHVSSAISSAIQDGAHCIQIYMADVVYISSAGIRVLMTFYKQLKHIGGELVVVSPSDEVRTILELTGLGSLLTTGASPTTATGSVEAASADRVATSDPRFELHNLEDHKPVILRLIGNTANGVISGAKERKSVPIRFEQGLFGFGIKR